MDDLDPELILPIRQNLVNNKFRKPTDFEVEILRCMLSVEFPDVELLRSQVDALVVKSLDEDGCLELHVESGTSAVKASGIPVEASYVSDGDWEPFRAMTHILLHVSSEGFMKELEFYNDAPGEIRKPDLSQLHIEVKRITVRTRCCGNLRMSYLPRRMPVLIARIRDTKSGYSCPMLTTAVRC